MKKRKLSKIILSLALSLSMLAPVTASAADSTGDSADATTTSTNEAANPADSAGNAANSADTNSAETAGNEAGQSQESAQVTEQAEAGSSNAEAATQATAAQASGTDTKSAPATDTEKIRVIVDIAEAKWTNEKNEVTAWDKNSIGIHYWGSKITKLDWNSDPKMTKVEGKENQYYYDVPKGTDAIIFRSMGGTSMQTEDIKDVRSDVTYYVNPATGAASVGAPKFTVTMKDASGKEVKPVEKKVDSFHVRFDNSYTKWNKVAVHYWGSGISGTTWPGKEMTKSSTDSKIFEADVPVGATGIVFTNPDDPDKTKSADVTDLPKEKDVTAEYVGVAVENKLVVVLRKDANGKTYTPIENPTTDEEKTAQQINVHVGKDYSQVILSFTTPGKTDGLVTYKSDSETEKSINVDPTFSYNAEKYKYTVTLKNLKPATKYTYTIGEGTYAKSGSFTTLPDSSSSSGLKFAYLCDPQIGSESTAEATSALFHYLNTDQKDLNFIYMGGDITDNGDSKDQWNYFFNTTEGEYKDATATALSNTLIAVTQGNHDKNHDTSSLNGYINAPEDGGKLVYTINSGKARFVVLNLETANGHDDERDSQEAYLEKEVKAAKEAGQWVIVGFHKSIYTGASHLTDADIVAARKYWSPVFSKLGVDMVLQAHDHVLARGFVNGDGTRGDSNGNVTVDAGTYYTNEKAPLYMVGGHAGGLKWYSAKKLDGKVGYTVSDGDPLLPAYSFLDVDSANPDLLGDNTTDKTHETMYTILSIGTNAITSTTYAFGYDQVNHKVTKAPYVYDTFTIKKQAGTVTIKNTAIENADGTKTETSTIDPSKSYTIELNKEITFFDNTKVNSYVMVDDKIVDPKNYDVMKGSTIIKFHPDFLKTLSVGEHTVKVAFTDNTSAETTVKVAESTATGDTEKQNVSDNSQNAANGSSASVTNNENKFSNQTTATKTEKKTSISAKSPKTGEDTFNPVLLIAVYGTVISLCIYSMKKYYGKD